MKSDNVPRTIVQSASSNVSVESSAFLQSYAAARKAIQRQRSKAFGTASASKIPQSGAQIQTDEVVVRLIEVNLFCFGTPEKMMPIE